MVMTATAACARSPTPPSLTGATNEGHVKSVGADAYVAKFVASDLAETIGQVLARST